MSAAKKELTKRQRMKKLRRIIAIEYAICAALCYLMLGNFKAVGTFAVLALIVEGLYFFYDLPESRKTLALRYWTPVVCLGMTALLIGV